MNHRRIGIRSSADAALFLVSDWVNLSGMNNSLMYGVGCWGANSSGGADASPYNSDIIYGGAEDDISNVVVTNAPSSSFQENGDINFSTARPPTYGYVFVTYGNAIGASAQRVFQAGSFTTEIGTQNIQTWKSYIDHNSMWIGDTPSKRLFFYNDGSNVSKLQDLTTNGDINETSNPTNPLIVGTNFSSQYTEGSNTGFG